VSTRGWVEGLACADPGARTPTSPNGNSYNVYSRTDYISTPVYLWICLCVLRFQNSQRNPYWGQPGASYWSSEQYKTLTRCKQNTHCCSVWSQTWIAWGSRTPAQFLVLVFFLNYHEVSNYVMNSSMVLVSCPKVYYVLFLWLMFCSFHIFIHFPRQIWRQNRFIQIYPTTLWRILFLINYMK
jgi:hypothetical protein